MSIDVEGAEMQVLGAFDFDNGASTCSALSTTAVKMIWMP